MAALLGAWADLYGGSSLVAIAVTFLHLAGLLAAGGIALALDRSVLRAVKDPTPSSSVLEELSASHSVVIGGMALIVITGVLMTAADASFYLSSGVFWLKMILFAVLTANGWVLKRHGDGLLEDGLVHERLVRLGTALRRSAFLWFATLLAGVVLTLA